jgi:uncharacterized protein
VTIVIAGGTGFLGSALAAAWRADGHRVLVLTRRPGPPERLGGVPPGPPRHGDDVHWTPGDGGGPWADALAGADGVINLAGEGIADKRWTAARKTAILESRLRATRALVAAIRSATTPPRVLISSSAIGIYGTDRGDEPLTEDSATGADEGTPVGRSDRDFLAQVCRQWENAAAPAADVTRLVLLRTGLVLAGHGGALPQMALPFRFFAGGKVGSGRQYMSWIHLVDWVSMVRWALVTPDVSGPLNATAPAPVTNAEFSLALGRAMGRPAVIPAPAFALRLALGEMADALLLGGQRVLPAKAQRVGFSWQFAQVDEALRDIYR